MTNENETSADIIADLLHEFFLKIRTFFLKVKSKRERG
jgi:hypothetical protein